MPNYDRRCNDCGRILLDQLEKIDTPNFDCDDVSEIWEDEDIFVGQVVCPGVMERVWLQGAANGVVDDSIPGGLEIKNALCHPDGTPRRFDSKTDIKRAAEAGGWTNAVEHIPSRGSDKSPHTVRWTGSPNCCTPELEAARVAAWHEHEATLK